MGRIAHRSIAQSLLDNCMFVIEGNQESWCRTNIRVKQNAKDIGWRIKQPQSQLHFSVSSYLLDALIGSLWNQQQTCSFIFNYIFTSKIQTNCWCISNSSVTAWDVLHWGPKNIKHIIFLLVVDNYWHNFPRKYILLLAISLSSMLHPLLCPKLMKDGTHVFCKNFGRKRPSFVCFTKVTSVHTRWDIYWVRMICFQSFHHQEYNYAKSSFQPWQQLAGSWITKVERRSLPWTQIISNQQITK